MTSIAAQNHRHVLSWITTLALCGPLTITVLAADASGAEEDAYKIEPPFAWNRTDRYEPPNFDGFFPNDVAAGQQLDLLLDGKLKVNNVDDRLALVRRGLRSTSRHRTTLLGAIGNEFIWNKDSQDPRAIEFLYHASGSPNAEVVHYALYHGPTVVAQRTPNLVRMLMERYHSLDGQMQRRIAWGMQTYGDKEHTRKLLTGLLNEHKTVNDATVCATLDTYQAVFETPAPDLDRFANVGKWVIAFHRTDLSADHPRAAKILRESLDHISLQNGQLQLLDFVTRVDDGHETGVALVQGLHSRTILTSFLTQRVSFRIDFNELLSPQTLQVNRLREFARHFPDGLPPRAMPAYTRPPSDATYAYRADHFVAPAFDAFFADDAAAGVQLDAVYAQRDKLTLSDRELLELFRRGVRRSAYSPNEMFGWISGALGWPRDPLLTEILYQAVDSESPLAVRDAGIYYGFGLGTAKTRNILEAMFRVYMTPPFDRTTNGNLRSRILWGVRDHEDDKHYLASRFAAALRDHAALTDPALQMADNAYRQLTGEDPPNAADYAARGLYLMMFHDSDARSIAAAKSRFVERLGESPHLVDSKFVENDGRVMGLALVRGTVGQKWLVEKLQTPPKVNIIFADLLTRDLIQQADQDVLRDFEKHILAKP